MLTFGAKYNVFHIEVDLEINLTKEAHKLYGDNYKVLLREIKEGPKYMKRNNIFKVRKVQFSLIESNSV